MKSKLLFAAALVAAGVVGTQAVRLTNGSWSFQLFENQQSDEVNLLAENAAEVRDVQTLSYQGTTVESGKEYYLYNVGAKKFLEGGNSVGVQASFGEVGVPILFTLTGDNQYTLDTKISNGGDYHYLGNNGYMDSGAFGWTLTKVDDGNAYTLGSGNTYCGYDGSTTVMSMTLGDATSDNAKWLLVSKEERTALMSQATATSGVDASFFIANPNFSRNVNPWGWTDDNNMCSHLGNDDDKLVEIFNKESVNFHQTISGLPEGVYVVSCLGFYRNGDAQPAADSKDNGTEEINVYLYAGNNQTPFVSILDGFGKTTTGSMTVTLGGQEGKIPNWPAEAASDFRAGIYSRTEVPVIVTDGSLTLGVRKSVLATNDWTQFDSFRLTYYGNTTEAMQNALQAKVDEAHTLAEDWKGTVPTTYITQLNSVTVESCVDAAAYSAAIGEINDLENVAYTSRNEFIVGYVESKIYAESMQTAFPNADESAKNILNEVIATEDAKALASTDAAVWAEAAASLKSACKTYYEATDGMLADGVKNFDVTGYMVVNPGFEDENPLEGWDGLNEADIYTDGTYHMVRKGGRDWRVSQTVEVPNGLYSMSVQIGFAQSDRNQIFLESSYQKATTLFKWTGSATDEEILASWSNDEEVQRSSVGNVLVTDGKITMGVEWIKDSETLKFDNFRLVRVSDGATEIKNACNILKDEAEIFVESLPSVLKKKLQDALAEIPATDATATTTAYYEAYNSIVSEMEVCRPVGEITVCLYSLLNECKGYLEHSVSSSQTRNAFETVVDKVEGYINITDVNTLKTYNDELEAARQIFVQNAVPTGVPGFDVTFLYLKNPNFDGGSDGWNGDKPGQVVNGVPEFWNTKFDFNQSLTNLPNGKYKIEVQARHFGTDGRLYAKNATETVEQAIMANTVSGTTLGNGNLWNEAADMQKELESGSDASRISVTIDVTDGNLTVGMAASDAGSWVVFDDFRLIQLEVPAADVTLNEANAYDRTSDTYANVTMTRTLGTGKWNTFCVPFDMTAEQLAANHINKVVELAVDPASTSENINLTSTEVTEVKAGVPYLVQVDQDVTAISVDGVYVTAAAPVAQSLGTVGDYTVTMTGNYSAMNVPTDAYFISNNTFYVADADATVSLKGFRAYITLTAANGEPAAVNVRTISIDGNTEGDGTTGIGSVAGETADQPVNVYTLSGVKVKGGVKASEALDGLQRGIYIVNGKKIIK